MGRCFEMMQMSCFLSHFCPLILASIDDSCLKQWLLCWSNGDFSIVLISFTFIGWNPEKQLSLFCCHRVLNSHYYHFNLWTIYLVLFKICMIGFFFYRLIFSSSLFLDTKETYLQNGLLVILRPESLWVWSNCLWFSPALLVTLVIFFETTHCSFF